MNGRLDRRALLAGVVSGTATTLAGCSTGQKETARIGELRLINQGSRTRQVAVRIETDGRRMLDETYEVGHSEGSPVQAGDSALPTTRGEQTITVDVVESEASASQTYREGTCYSVIADFGDGDVGFYSNEGEHNCSAGTPQQSERLRPPVDSRQ